MVGGTTMVAERVLGALAAGGEMGAVVMLATTEEGCGGYGRVAVDPWHAIEVRFFGWPRVDPGSVEVEPSAVASMARHGFVFDGTDWVWRRHFLPELVPAAAHAAGRVLAEVWKIDAAEADRLLDVRRLEASDVMMVAAGERCDRCSGGSCARGRR